MITVSHTTPIPASRRARGELSLTKSQKRTIERYRGAYKTAYGVTPTVEREGIWIKVQGMSSRVSIRRLRELADQLHYRAG